MTFTQSDRVWWDTSKPGRSTSQLTDATPSAAEPASPDEDTGIVGWHRGRLYVCERSGFVVPYDETVLDPITGRRVWDRFVDEEPPEPTDG